MNKRARSPRIQLRLHGSGVTASQLHPHFTEGRGCLWVSSRVGQVPAQHLGCIKAPRPNPSKTCPWPSGLQLWSVLGSLFCLGGRTRELLRCLNLGAGSWD